MPQLGGSPRAAAARIGRNWFRMLSYSATADTQCDCDCNLKYFFAVEALRPIPIAAMIRRLMWWPLINLRELEQMHYQPG